MDEKMDEIKKEPRNYPTEEVAHILPAKADASELLDIAKEVEQIINQRMWSWCTMDRVYRVLKAAHQ